MDKSRKMNALINESKDKFDICQFNGLCLKYSYPRTKNDFPFVNRSLVSPKID